VVIAEQVWIRPMTSEIVPLVEGPLKARFDAIAARCGLDAVPVFVGGQDNTVIGAGPLRRILISKYELDHAATAEGEVVSTFSHELEHYRSADPELALALVGVLFVLGAFAVHALGGAAIRRWGTRFGFSTLADPAALPLMFAILIPYWVFGAQPALNAVQRHVEWQADRFALEVTRDNRSRASQLARELTTTSWRLHEYYAFFEIFQATHPSDADRVRVALTHQPWTTGRAGELSEQCEPP
jgi:STE24 endopeptidase